jgi:predicted GNAT family acetyltransferase
MGHDGVVPTEDATAPAGSDRPTRHRVTDNEAASRFEIEVDGRLAELVYRRTADQLVLIHTGVPPQLEGLGLGGELVQAALDDAERRNLAVVPRCPFARAWLERHPGQAARVRLA